MGPHNSPLPEHIPYPLKSGFQLPRPHSNLLARSLSLSLSFSLCFALLRGWRVGRPHAPRSRRYPLQHVVGWGVCTLSVGVKTRVGCTPPWGRKHKHTSVYMPESGCPVASLLWYPTLTRPYLPDPAFIPNRSLTPASTASTFHSPLHLYCSRCPMPWFQQQNQEGLSLALSLSFTRAVGRGCPLPARASALSLSLPLPLSLSLSLSLSWAWGRVSVPGPSGPPLSLSLSLLVRGAERSSSTPRARARPSGSWGLRCPPTGLPQEARLYRTCPLH